ncbi:MAG: CxxC-x17-CxxC domain-containing protein [Deltaproteobacteria bacterium]
MKSFSSKGKFGKKNSSRSEGGDSKRPSRGSFSRSEGRDAGRPAFGKQSHRAVCDKCGTNCEVPFKPTGSKPIYCQDCFRTMGDSESPRPRQFGRREYPVSRRLDNFKKSEYSESAGPDQSKRELEQINFKLDKILRILEEE